LTVFREKLVAGEIAQTHC